MQVTAIEKEGNGAPIQRHPDPAGALRGLRRSSLIAMPLTDVQIQQKTL
jgi:hypothetical protein